MGPAPRSVRRVGFVAVVCLSLVAVATVSRLRALGPDRVAWRDDVPTAAAAAGRPVLLDFTSDQCPACHQMRQTTWADPAVAADVAARCVAVRIDTDAQPDRGQRYRIQVLPTLVLTTPDGRELRRAEGYQSPADLRRWLAGG